MRHVHPLAHAGARAGGNGGHNAIGQHVPAHHIREGETAPVGGVAVGATGPHDAGAGLAGGIKGRPSRLRPPAAVPGGACVNQARIDLQEFVIAQPQPVQDAGAEVFNEDIGVLDQRQKQGFALRRGEVDHDRAFVAVHHFDRAAAAVGEADVDAGGGDEVAHEIAAGPLDLDYIGAQVSQHRAGQRPQDEVGYIDHRDTGQRLYGHRLLLVHVP